MLTQNMKTETEKVKKTEAKNDWNFFLNFN